MFLLLNYVVLPILVLALFYVAVSQTVESVRVTRGKQPQSKEGLFFRVCSIVFGSFFMATIAGYCLEISHSPFATAIVYLGLALSLIGICVNKILLPIYLHIFQK